MYRRGGSIGCLNGSITKIGDSLNGSIESACNVLDGTISRISDVLDGAVVKMCSELKGTLNNLCTPLVGSVSLVCSVNKDFYLDVEPDIIWLTPDSIGEEFEITSNVVWRIE